MSLGVQFNKVFMDKTQETSCCKLQKIARTVNSVALEIKNKGDEWPDNQTLIMDCDIYSGVWIVAYGICHITCST